MVVAGLAALGSRLAGFWRLCLRGGLGSSLLTWPILQPEERTRLHDELEEAKDKARRRSIGNIKFIGELFKLKMLTEAIMHDCVVKLLKNHDEESLECLCRLLTTIGKDLDFEKAKVRGKRACTPGWPLGRAWPGSGRGDA